MCSADLKILLKIARLKIDVMAVSVSVSAYIEYSCCGDGADAWPMACNRLQFC